MNYGRGSGVTLKDIRRPQEDTDINHDILKVGWAGKDSSQQIGRRGMWTSERWGRREGRGPPGVRPVVAAAKEVVYLISLCLRKTKMIFPSYSSQYTYTDVYFSGKFFQLTLWILLLLLLIHFYTLHIIVIAGLTGYCTHLFPISPSIQTRSLKLWADLHL